MKIDALIALVTCSSPSPPDDVLRAAAFEALDMVTTAVDSLKRIADAQDGGAAISHERVAPNELARVPRGYAWHAVASVRLAHRGARRHARERCVRRSRSVARPMSRGRIARRRARRAARFARPDGPLPWWLESRVDVEAIVARWRGAI